MTNSKAALVLAAGQGKRMRSKLPKVLHTCCEFPLIAHVVQTARSVGCSPIVVVLSPDGAPIREYLLAQFPDVDLRFAVQAQALGTGDAARAGLSELHGVTGKTLILYGDVPLLTEATLTRLDQADTTTKVAFLTAHVAQPHGYGRVVRQNGEVVAIVEERDATPEQRAITEVNAGVYLCDTDLLRTSVGGLTTNNAQHEFYLTDIVAIAAKQKQARGIVVHDADDIRGVNNPEDLGQAEAIMRRRLITAHASRGVVFRDPANTFISATVKIGSDVTIGVGAQLYGTTDIGDNVAIEGPCVIRDATIGADAHVYAFSHIEQAVIGRGCSVGPFARLRPDTVLESNVRIGNFVEVKKSKFGAGSKANHLAYVGDAVIGAQSNLGAGTITCNYDGYAKHRTTLGDGVFVGSNSTLVAPVTLEQGAYVAAGSTVTEDVPQDALAFGRARQVNRQGHAARLRERLSPKEKK